MGKTLVVASFCCLISIACKTQSQSILGSLNHSEGKSLIADQSRQYCPLTANNPADWSKCVGLLVKVKGTASTEIAQHVMRNFDLTDHDTGHQSYMDALNYQFVLLSNQPIQCRNEFEVEGVLNYFTLGGSADTKSGYANYEIRVKAFDCLESSDGK